MLSENARAVKAPPSPAGWRRSGGTAKRHILGLAAVIYTRLLYMKGTSARLADAVSGFAGDPIPVVLAIRVIYLITPPSGMNVFVVEIVIGDRGPIVSTFGGVSQPAG